MNLEIRDKYLTDFKNILDLRELADSTIKNYTRYFEEFLDWLESDYDDRDPRDLSWKDLRVYINHLKNKTNSHSGKKLNPRSINPRIAQLHDFYAYVLHKVWDKYQLPSLRYDTYLPVVPTAEEAYEFIYSLDNLKHRAIVAVIYSAGLRVSEAVSLKYNDIVASRGYIIIRKTKNRSERRAILAKRTLAILTQYWISIGKPQDGGYLFPGQRQDSHLSTESVRRFIKKHLEQLSWKNNYTPHSFRHCFALTLLQNGTDLLTIKYALGHKSIHSTSAYLVMNNNEEGQNYISPFDMEISDDRK